MSLLPVGSVVELDGSAFMVAGIGSILDGECYRYSLIPYPHGFTFDKDMLLVNDEDIDRVLFEGYRDEDSDTFEQLVNIALDNFRNSNINSSITK